MKKIPLLFLLTIAFCFVGCNKNVPLQGKVTFSDDGSPVSDGVVNIETDTFRARGPIKSDGTYVMGSYKPKDGLPQGTYRVSVTGDNLYVVTKVNPEEGYDIPLIAPKFESGYTSGIEIVIDGKTKTFDFSVERNPAYIKHIAKQKSKR